MLITLASIYFKMSEDFFMNLAWQGWTLLYTENTLKN